MLHNDIDAVATHMREAWGARADAPVSSHSTHAFEARKVSILTNDSRVYTGVVTSLDTDHVEVTNGMDIYVLDNAEIISSKLI